MLTNKEKRYLKALGAKLEPVVQVGKAGIAPAVVDGAAGVIEGRELIKVRVLKNSPEEPAEAIARLAEGVGAELVQVIGRNGLLFKRNAEKPKVVFPAAGAAPVPAVKAPPAGKAKPAESKAAAPKPRGAAKPAAGKAFGSKPQGTGKSAGRPTCRFPAAWTRRLCRRPAWLRRAVWALPPCFRPVWPSRPEAP